MTQQTNTSTIEHDDTAGGAAAAVQEQQPASVQLQRPRDARSLVTPAVQRVFEWHQRRATRGQAS